MDKTRQITLDPKERSFLSILRLSVRLQRWSVTRWVMAHGSICLGLKLPCHAKSRDGLWFETLVGTLGLPPRILRICAFGPHNSSVNSRLLWPSG